MPEAHAIATRLGFQTRIYEILHYNNNLHLLATVGTGNDRPLSLLWHNQHYRVLNGGANLNNQPYNANLIAHDPTGDGNCMYEAMFYIYRNGGGNNLSTNLAQDHVRRATHVAHMRGLAADNFDPVLANILGEELAAQGADEVFSPVLVSREEVVSIVAELYKAFPPRTHYLVKDKTYFFHTRSDKARAHKSHLGSLLQLTLNVADKDLRAAVLATLERDSSYFPDEKQVKKQLGSFDRTNSATWNMLAPVLIDGVTQGDVNGVILSATDRRYWADILAGLRTTNSSSGGAQTLQGYHSHMANNGGGGVAFYYRNTSGNNVEPVIYAVASSRNNNDYVWSHRRGTSNSHPVPLGGYV